MKPFRRITRSRTPILALVYAVVAVAAAAGESWPERERFDPVLARVFVDWTRASMNARLRSEGFTETESLGALARYAGAVQLLAVVDGEVKADVLEDRPLPLAGNLRAASNRVADALGKEDGPRASLFLSLIPAVAIHLPTGQGRYPSSEALEFGRRVALGLDGVLAVLPRRDATLTVTLTPLTVLHRRMDWEEALQDLAGRLAPPAPGAAVRAEAEAERLLRQVIARPEFRLRTVPVVTVFAPADGGAPYIYYRHGGLVEPAGITADSLAGALDRGAAWLAEWLAGGGAAESPDPAAGVLPPLIVAGNDDNDDGDDDGDGNDGRGGDGEDAAGARTLGAAAKLRFALALDAVGRARGRRDWREIAWRTTESVLGDRYRDSPLDPSVGYLLGRERPDANLSALALLALAQREAAAPAEANRARGERIFSYLAGRGMPDPSRWREGRDIRPLRAALGRREACRVWRAVVRRAGGADGLRDDYDLWTRHFSDVPPPPILLPALAKGHFHVYGAAREAEVARRAFATARGLAGRQRLRAAAHGPLPADERGFFDGPGAGGGGRADVEETAESVEALAQVLYLARLGNDTETARVLFPAVVWGTRALLQAQVRDLAGCFFLSPEGRPGVGAFRRSAGSPAVGGPATASALRSLAMVYESFSPADYARAAELLPPE